MIGTILLVIGAAAAVIAFVASSERPGFGTIRHLVSRKSAQGCCLCKGNDCIAGLLVNEYLCFERSGLLDDLYMLAKRRGIRGVLVMIREEPLRKMLRALEADLITQQVILERNPSNVAARIRAEVIRNLIDDIASGRGVVKASLVLIVGGERGECMENLEALSDYVEARGCRPRILCGERLVEQLIVGSRTVSDVAPLDDIGKAAAEVMQRSHRATTGVFIGRELGSGIPVFIKLWERGGRHSIIVGPTGKGKTTLLATIFLRVRTAYEGVASKLIDPKGDLSVMLSSIGVDVIDGECVMETIELCKRMPTCRAGNALNIERSLKQCDKAVNPIEDSVITLSSISEEVRDRVLKSIVSGLLGAKRMFPKAPLLIVIDEAWRLAASRDIVKRIVKEARSLNTALVLATQDPSDIPEEVWNNSSTIIVFGSADEEYIKRVSRVVKLSGRLKDQLRRLRVGEAVVQSIDEPHPVIVRLKPEPLLLKSRG